MYADDIVIFSETQERLQERMDLLHTYCSNWCLSVNLSKTNVVIFNKAGKCLKHPIYFNGTLIRSASLYRYLGFTISSSGKCNQCKLDLYKKSMKAYFKLQNYLS
jgi:hypothetical protein